MILEKRYLCILWTLYFWPFTAIQAQHVGNSYYECTIEQGTSLKSTIEKMAKDYHIDFAYPTLLLEHTQSRSKTFRSSTLDELLRQLLQDTDIDFLVTAPNKVLLRQWERPESTSLKISGRLFQAGTRTALPYASVALDTLNIGTMTGEDGVFLITIPAGFENRHLEFHLLGYSPKKIAVKEILQQRELSLQQIPIEIKEVVVVDKIPSIRTPSFAPYTALHNRDQAFAGLNSPMGADIFRQVQLLPGVAAHDDGGSEIKIRGSDGDATLIVLDGIPIYQADHYYGVFSSINNSFVDEAELYKNSFPPEYGGKTGGMLLLRSSDKAASFAGNLDLNLLQSSLRLDIPLGPKSFFKLGGRVASANLAQIPMFDKVNNPADPSGIFTGDRVSNLVQTEPAFSFYDVNAKWSYQFSNKTKADLNFYNSADDFLNEYRLAYQSRLGPIRVRNEEFFSNTEKWWNTGASFNIGITQTPKQSIAGNVYFTRSENRGGVQSSLLRVLVDSLRTDRITNEQRNYIQDIGGFIKSHFDLPQEQQIEVGAGLIHHQNFYRFDIDNRILTEKSNKSLEINLFGNYSKNFGPHRLEVGGRMSLYELTQKLYFSPRVNYFMSLADGHTLKASISRNYQFVRQTSYENRLGQSFEYQLLADGENLPVGAANNYMIGCQWQSSPWSLDVEGYHKHLLGAVEYLPLTPGFSEAQVKHTNDDIYQIFSGINNTTGLDVLLKYDKKPYQGWISYTLSKSNNRFPAIYNNQAFPSQEDRRHQVKWVNSLQLGRLQLSGSLVFSSGRAYTDISVFNGIKADRIQVDPKMILKKLPDYQRWDAGINYPFWVKNTQVSAGFSIFNLTNHHNIKYIQQVYSVPSNNAQQRRENVVIGAESGLLERTLNFSLKMNW